MNTQRTPNGNQTNENWKPLPVFLAEIKKNYQQTLAIFQYHGFIDCDHNWSKEILRPGIVQHVSYIETDLLCGIEKRIHTDLISPHGELFLREFLETDM